MDCALRPWLLRVCHLQRPADRVDAAGPPRCPKAVLLAFALASADLALAACWAVCLDVGVEHAGVVTGFMNTFGNLGGLVGPSSSVSRWIDGTHG